MTKIKGRREEKKENVLLNIIIGGLTGFVIFLIFLILFSFAELKIGFGKSFYLPLLLFFGSVSGLVNGFVTVRPVKRCAVPFASASGAVEAVLCLLISLASNKTFGGINLFTLLVLIIIFSAVGGAVAANLRLRKKY